MSKLTFTGTRKELSKFLDDNLTKRAQRRAVLTVDIDLRIEKTVRQRLTGVELEAYDAAAPHMGTGQKIQAIKAVREIASTRDAELGSLLGAKNFVERYFA